jgi:hypothetical protein
MEWLLFRLELWRKQRAIERYHQWLELELRDRFDSWPCRDCDVSEGMWW